MKKLILFISLISSISSAFAQELTAKQILEKSENKLRGTQSSYAEMKITTVRPKWTREMSIKSWSKGKEGMILITEPVKEKGIVFLKKEKEVWNWVPSIERTTKMPPSMMMQSWMGTDMTNDDLVKQTSTVDDYTHVLGNDTTINGNECYQITLIPKEDALVVWGKIEMCIDKKHFVQLHVKFYDEYDELVNVMNSYEITYLGGKMLPKRMELIPQDKKGHKTIIEYQLLKFDIEIDDNFFSVQNMKKIK